MAPKNEHLRLNTDKNSPAVKTPRRRLRVRRSGKAVTAKKLDFLQKMKERYSRDPKLFKMDPQVVLYRDPRSPNKIPFCYEENEPARSTKLVVRSEPRHRSVRTISRKRRVLIWCFMMMAVLFAIIIESE